MKKIFFIFVLLLLASCQSAEEILTLQKKTNTDEFLVEKKNPLVLPPDYDKLPTPMDKKKIDDNNDTDFSSSLDKIKNNPSKSNSELESSSLEEVILKKIK
tara:strand:- start:104 stop:406 length:303 start_codon:yes stop_codon:yes gene_type:complete